MHEIPSPGEMLARSREGGGEDVVLDPIHWRTEPMDRISPIHNRRISRRARRKARKRRESGGADETVQRLLPGS